MSKTNTYTGEWDGFTLTWTGRRSQVDCDVSKDGVVVSELVYPKLFGGAVFASHEAFKQEAVAIAKRELQKTSGATA